MATIGTAELSQAKWNNLERKWRRVASTHTLQILMEENKAFTPKQFSLQTFITGCVLVFLGVGSLSLYFFAMLVAPCLPASTFAVVNAVQADKYYHLLIPLTIPVTIITVFLNWFFLKIFKHNS